MMHVTLLKQLILKECLNIFGGHDSRKACLCASPVFLNPHQLY